MTGLAYVIRPAESGDVGAIAEIEQASFGDPWARRLFVEAMHSPVVHLAVAEAPDGRVVGYCVLRVAADEAEILNVAVAPERRRAGLGALLVAWSVEEAGARGATALYLEVRPSNTAARRLYEAFGFAEIGRRRLYYRHPDEDALVMRRDVGPRAAAAQRPAAAQPNDPGGDVGTRSRQDFPASFPTPPTPLSPSRRTT